MYNETMTISCRLNAIVPIHFYSAPYIIILIHLSYKACILLISSKFSITDCTLNARDSFVNACKLQVVLSNSKNFTITIVTH